MNAARNEGYGLLDRARTRSTGEGESGARFGRDETQAQLSDAKKELAEASDRAVRELEGQADALARSLASRVLGRDVA